MKHIVCYSGGHSSALVAVEVARRFGPADVVLLNHDINPNVEDADIKRFKNEVAAFLGLPITYANMDGWETMDQFDVTVKEQAFQVGNGQALCTNRMKTRPFEKWLAENAPPGEATIYYGFDANEVHRIQRRSSHLGGLGYRTDYPLALWTGRTIKSTKDIGIEPPQTYGQFKHANCVGCLKAGRQHWYVVYCTRPDVWAKALWAEDVIDHSIIKGVYLAELAPQFAKMKAAGVTPTEHVEPATFWAAVDRTMKAVNLGQISWLDADLKPCECVF